MRVEGDTEFRIYFEDVEGCPIGVVTEGVFSLPALCHHKDVVIRCQRPIMRSTDKQKRKTLTQMAAGDTTVGSRPCEEPSEFQT